MSFAKKFNKTERLFNVDTKEFDFVSLKELLEQNGTDHVYPLRGMYINTKSQYGAQPVFITDGLLVNVPSHLLDTAKEIMRDVEAVADINAGRAGFKIYEYTSDKYKRTSQSVEFVDLQTDDIEF